MKILLGKIKESLSWKNLQKSCLDFFWKGKKWFFLAFILALLGYWGHLWYANIHSARWSGQKKEEYIKTKDTGVIFNGDKFNDIVKEQEQRKNNYNKDMSDLQDIFKLKEKVPVK